MSLIKKILQLKRKCCTLFTTPSHGQKMPFKSLLGEKYYTFDMSEIDGLDNLNNPKECILELEEQLQKNYFSKLSVPLTNGSTQGILALLLAVLKPHDKVLAASNCHKSVHNAIILSGAEPVWVTPNFNSDFGIFTSISPTDIEAKLNEIKDIRCVVITNPTYDGSISNIEKIANVCKEKNIVLIVDEAHGGLWNFDKTIGTPAILCGADASVQSLHKTCGAVNPTAILHLSKNSAISTQRLLSTLNLISTTSPAYPSIINIEETVTFLSSKKGQKALDTLSLNIMETRKKIKKLEFFELLEKNVDITKICVRPTRISAEEVSDIIYKKFKLECEIQHARALTFLCGLGTDKQKLKKLYAALKYINKISKNKEPLNFEPIVIPEREQKITPNQAFNAEYDFAAPEEAIGKICAEIITSYPPGIPVLTFGELIKKEHLNFLSSDTKIRIVK